MLKGLTIVSCFFSAHWCKLLLPSPFSYYKILNGRQEEPRERSLAYPGTKGKKCLIGILLREEGKNVIATDSTWQERSKEGKWRAVSPPAPYLGLEGGRCEAIKTEIRDKNHRLEF